MKHTATESYEANIGLAPQARTGDSSGTGVDTRGFDECLVVLNVGVCTDGVYDVVVQDSADNSTFADITNASFTTITTTADSGIEVGRINLREYERYLRIDVDETTAGSVGVIMGATFILTSGRDLPVTQVATAAFSV